MGQKLAGLRKESHRTAFLLPGANSVAIKRLPSSRPACFWNNIPCLSKPVQRPARTNAWE